MADPVQRIVRPADRLVGWAERSEAQRMARSARLVGWVERSEAQRKASPLLGFTLFSPTYDGSPTWAAAGLNVGCS
jgi:hypothetical protein